jgi:hypothetical protein
LPRERSGPESFLPGRQSLSPRVSIEKADTCLRLENKYCILLGQRVRQIGGMLMTRKSYRAAVNGGLLIISIFISFAIGEILLRAFTVFPIHSAFANRKFHPSLGWVMDSAIPDIDCNGFRNACVMEHPDIVTIGDSHTYGYNVKREDSWPMQLAKKTGLEIYNMGMGGYGFQQYLYLLERAIAMKPCAIIIGCFPTNDLVDYIYFDYHRADAEAQSSEHAAQKKSLWQLIRHAGENFTPPRLYANSAICSMLRYYFYDPSLDFIQVKLNPERTSAGQKLIIKYGPYSTIINATGTVLKNIDPADPKLGAALMRLGMLFNGPLQKARDGNIRVYFLFIPAKESIWYDYMVENKYPIDTGCKEVVFRENELVQKLAGYFKAQGAETCYFRKEMALAVKRGARIWPSSSDRHPNANGYKIYADVAYALLLKDSELLCKNKLGDR